MYFRAYSSVDDPELQAHPGFRTVPAARIAEMRVVQSVYPFRVNTYVLDRLVDWSNPEDPLFRMLFPQREMLHVDDFARLQARLAATPDGPPLELVREIRHKLNPHPSQQLTKNVPKLADGTRLRGMQHKYPPTVLFFPRQGQTCHSYCSFCFRWPQFVGDPELRIESSEITLLKRYLVEHPEVLDVLITGGDPFVMKTEILRRYVEPLLTADVATVRTLRFGTKAITYWPYRFTSDPDAPELLKLLEATVRSGRQVAIMAHVTHPRELSPEPVRAAIRALRSIGCQIRTQTPLLRGINTMPGVLSALWNEEIRLGMIPYYLFMARDTGAQDFFGVPVAEALSVYQREIAASTGLSGTLRGPVMSADPGKVQVLDRCTIAGEEVFVCRFLQARNPVHAHKTFMAHFDAEAVWLDGLAPAFGEARFFFDRGSTSTSIPSLASPLLSELLRNPPSN